MWYTYIEIQKQDRTLVTISSSWETRIKCNNQEDADIMYERIKHISNPIRTLRWTYMKWKRSLCLSAKINWVHKDRMYINILDIESHPMIDVHKNNPTLLYYPDLWN